MKKIRLYGFNNLTKTLSFNIYDICYANNNEDRASYIEYIDERYNSKRLTNILCEVAEMIGAHILHISAQDYEPQGSSVTVMVAEEEVKEPEIKTDIAAHLDKSHLTVHTYPESHPQKGICTFRVDIDVSTCGEISPLNALPFLIDSFDSDILSLDYRVRGFTREKNGNKLFIDHKIDSIQDFIPDSIKRQYHTTDVNLKEERIFHTNMLIKEYDLDNYLFTLNADDLHIKNKKKIQKQLEHEMREIYYGRNFKG